ncbi:UDP-N-acetylmuramyl peptide synthase [Legionella fallonii]|uniref:Putative cyanophycin synthase n=1 Tax=Legionella fallonii LLAP-10 TaxID=1212491 RepID=A0A098G039_9GAMM|nr:UDP-N-acetylmuramyl peptide synthase [Legionella fallonii]CEG55857.1 putative cyanophycin synthase [Legionella fallonii LLAP-10]
MPVKSLEEIDGFELKLGSHYYLFKGCETPFNKLSSSNIAADKYCTNKLLERAEIPVPSAVAIHVDEFNQNLTEEIIAELKFPLVIKPLLNGAQGKDVLCNIQTLEELLIHLEKLFASYDYLMIEEFHGKLKSYRVLVFNRKVVGVVIRHPASIIGDGKHTIEELIALTNIARKKTNDFLGPIIVDDECLIRLKELGIGVNYIPSIGKRIVLCYTSNATRGGTYEALGKQICKENRKLMIHVARVLDLGLAGIDVECADINTPIEGSNGVIIEVNHRPSIRIHEFPISGTPHLVTKQIMRSFIFRHPVAYLCSLYSNKHVAFYIRLFILISIIGLIYFFT